MWISLAFINDGEISVVVSRFEDSEDSIVVQPLLHAAVDPVDLRAHADGVRDRLLPVDVDVRIQIGLAFGRDTDRLSPLLGVQDEEEIGSVNFSQDAQHVLGHRC